MAYNGGLFKVDEVMISFLHALQQSGTTDTVILDSNDNPVDVNVKELFDKCMSRYHEAVNTYHKLYKELRR